MDIRDIVQGWSDQHLSVGWREFAAFEHYGYLPDGLIRRHADECTVEPIIAFLTFGHEIWRETACRQLGDLG